MNWLKYLIAIGVISCFLQEAQCQQLPIKPSRTISFETDEGSYMNLAISPDGKTLLFDLLGDIYSISSKGGDAKQITRGLAMHSRPLFSANGKQMIFQSDLSGEMKIHVCNLDGTDDRIVSDIQGRQDTVTSSNGMLIAYVKRKPDKGKCLVIADLESKREKILVSSLSVVDTTAGYDQQFCFSPDSKSIFISYGGKIHRISTDTGKDEIIPFKAKVNADLGPLSHHTYPVSQKPFNSNYIRGSVASPDGKQLFFVALSQLYSMTLSNGKAKPIVKQDAGQFQPAISPDGKWIAYVSWNDQRGGFLWKVPSKGGVPVQLTKLPGQYQQPSWSPDGKRLAVVRGAPKLQRREDFDLGMLELIAADGKSVQSVTDSVPLWNTIKFSADGKRITYRARQKKGKYFEAGVHPVLLSSTLDGKLTKTVANGKLDLKMSRQLQLFRQHHGISPDGKYLIYAEHESLFLVPVDRNSGKVPMMYDTIYNAKSIRFAMGMDPYWEQGGKVLCWTFGNKFFKVRTEKIVETANKIRQRRQLEGLPSEEYCIAEVVPDQTVDIRVNVPVLFGKGTIALKNVRILTMNGDEVIENGVILIKDGRIQNLGVVDIVAIPEGAQVKDLSGTTVMPGMIDTHLHLGVSSNVYPQQGDKYLASLAYGVTTARDPAYRFDSYACSELLAAGKMIGPRVFSVGRPAQTDLSYGLSRLNSIEDARYFIRKRKELGSVVVKQYGLPTRLMRQWLLLASHEAQVNMTNEGDDWLQNLMQIKDGSSGVEHDPEGNWRDVYSDVITFVSKSGTCLTPTLQPMANDSNSSIKGKNYFNYTYWRNPDKKLSHFLEPEVLKNLQDSKMVTTFPNQPDAKVNARFRKAGALIAMGSHGDNIGTGPHSELWALQMGGMGNMEALQSATIIGAKALGMDRDLGSIEVGKIADLIILNKNPLDDIHNSREIKYVMKDGVLYDGDTLETLWPFKRPAPEWKYKGEYETLIKHSDKP